ncbi:hypothetical protein LMG3458_04549 [Achromobacter deleyi]|uniref:Preprotein translocase subunit SecD n=1 Tax=Achromobacter deleyi TaxID=1353891 RepID=A0A6S7ANH5_9BURK|nr:hypothetical protein [Achromobacter deleyi]CAB3727699.1 hypothetical protein LMG3458_04549 [Achromobacter deleyi]CAB3885517.1 hypothetical protein LMG3412_03480 [Achromobacter deleyi]
MKAQDVLADDQNEGSFQGVTVRKGTVGAFLANARVWNDPAATPQARDDAERDMREAMPALRALGLFDVLQVRDAALRQWLDAA